MALTVSARLHAFISALAPLLVLMVTSTTVFSAGTVAQPPAPAQAWHKWTGQTFQFSIRDRTIGETYCVDIRNSYNGGADWSTAINTIGYTLSGTDGFTRWDLLDSKRVDFYGDRGNACDSGGNWYPDPMIRYYLHANSQNPCGWAQDPNGGWWKAGCVSVTGYRYQLDVYGCCGNVIWYRYAYNRSYVYLDQGRICCLPGYPSGWISGYKNQHVNHEIGHVLGLSDPPYTGYECPGSGSIMHQWIGYWCWDTNWPVAGWDTASVLNITQPDGPR